MKTKLLILTGPPAVGKLTVAQHVADLSTFRLFHNHLTFDTALSLFDYGTRDFFRLCDELRLTAIRFAIEAHVSGLILTFCIGTKDDIIFLERCVNLMNKNGGQCYFVTLHAPEAILLDRVTQKSRQKYAKVQDRGELRQLLSKFNFNTTPNYSRVLNLDTALHSPAKNASAILNWVQVS